MRYLIIFLITIVFCSCNLKQNVEPNAIARVNDSYLYIDEIKNVLVEGLSQEDSTLRVNNFINQWATQQLLVDGAKFNLAKEKQVEFDDLVNQYRQDLYTKGYLEALVKQSIDTSITIDEAKKVYKNNIETFKLNEELIMFRYINVNENSEGVNEVRERFKRFDKQDSQVLDSIAIQFKSYSLNDSIWIRLDQVISEIPMLSVNNKDQLLKKSNFIEHKDSLGLYLMQVKDVLRRNETAPLEYVLPTVNQIIINKRKLEFIKTLERDITKDAIKNKQFEIYD